MTFESEVGGRIALILLFGSPYLGPSVLIFVKKKTKGAPQSGEEKRIVVPEICRCSEGREQVSNSSVTRLIPLEKFQDYKHKTFDLTPST